MPATQSGGSKEVLLSRGKSGAIADDDDAEDLRAVATGDRHALARLHQRHAGALRAFIRRYVADVGLADEVLQDTFVAAWQSAGSFRGDARVRTWLFGIARRQAHNHVRRRVPEPIEAPELDADPRPAPDTEAIARLELDVVAEMIDQLSPAHREVLGLALAADLRYDEIASVLDVPVGTVKSRVANARAALARRCASAREAEG